ncbi:MAG: hypothetical protein ACFCU7_18000 [Pleurocapsa sp.]
MATNKKAISAYLSSDLEEYLTKYCTEYDITRKDKSGEIKPALGTAVVEILRIFFSDENVPSPLPDNVPLLPSNVVTENRLAEALSEFKKTSKVVDNVPSNVLTKDDLDKQVEAAINEAIPKAIAVLKSDEEFLGAIANSVVQKISTVATDNDKYPAENALEQAEVEEDEETITQIDKASLAPIFEDEDEDDVDFQSCTVSHLRKIVTIKGLGKKFREQLGKYPGNAKKAEIVKFLNETSIFDLD